MIWKRLSDGIAAAVPLTTKVKGDAAEDAALAYAQTRGMRLVGRQFKTPGRGGGELDLILRAKDGTLVFVEVRARASDAAGGAAASVSANKQRRIVLAARHYLSRLQGVQPPCRFDVCAIEDGRITWIEAAFEADL